MECKHAISVFLFFFFFLVGGGCGSPLVSLKYRQIRIRAQRKSKLKQELTAVTSNMLDYLLICEKVVNLPFICPFSKHFFVVDFSSFRYFGLYLHSDKSRANRMKYS